jgi:hypothetical protein
LSPSDEEKRISRARTIALGEANVFKHAIVHVPSVTAESQTVHPKMKREFSEGVNLIEVAAHDSLPLSQTQQQDAIADWPPRM